MMRVVLALAVAMLASPASAQAIKLGVISDSQGMWSDDHRMHEQVTYILTDASFGKVGVDAAVALGDCVDKGDAGGGGPFSPPGGSNIGDLAWPFVTASYARLIKHVPFLGVVGNHDMNTTDAGGGMNCSYDVGDTPCDLKWYSEHVGVVSGIYEDRGWFMGWMPDQGAPITYYTNSGLGPDSGDGGHGAQAWIQVSTAYGPMGIIGLGWADRAEMHAWAKGIADANPDMPFIVTSHRGMINSGVGGADCQTQMGGRWNSLINTTPNIFLALNGHSIGEQTLPVDHTGTGMRCYSQDDNLGGLAVLRSAFNYQLVQPSVTGGDARLRIYSIDVENDQICWKTRRASSDNPGWDTGDGNEVCVGGMDLAARFGERKKVTPGASFSAGASLQ